jgi:hypothetical protein
MASGDLDTSGPILTFATAIGQVVRKCQNLFGPLETFDSSGFSVFDICDRAIRMAGCKCQKQSTRPMVPHDGREHVQVSVWRHATDTRREFPMLYTIAVVLLVLWLLGFSVFHVAGALIHLVLVVALIVFVVGLVQGRSA